MTDLLRNTIQRIRDLKYPGALVPLDDLHHIHLYQFYPNPSTIISYEVDVKYCMIRTLVNGHVTDVWWYQDEESLVLELMSMDPDTFHQVGYGARTVVGDAGV